MPGAQVVIGVDAGGTTGRAVLATSTGTRLAAVTGPGVNPRSSAGDPAESLTALLGRLVAAEPEAAREVRLGVLGLTGAGPAGLRAAERAAAAAWESAGLPGGPHVVPDIAVAHAAGSPHPSGTVLVAGTGAVAAALVDGEIRRRADGHGWLLGDTGSAVWLGVQAARSALAALDGTEGATGLAADVLAALGVLDAGAPLPERSADRTALAQRAIGVVDGMRPAGLGGLAPVVSRAAGTGDPVACRLAAAAVDGLVRTLAAVTDGREDSDVVLAGSVLLAPGPVRSGVRAAIRERWGVEARDSGDGAGGAAVLALRRCGRRVTAETHARLTTP